MTEDLVGRILAGGSVGVIATLLLVIYLLITERLVVGTVYRRTEAKLARFEELAYKAMALAERATGKDGSA